MGDYDWNEDDYLTDMFHSESVLEDAGYDRGEIDSMDEVDLIEKAHEIEHGNRPIRYDHGNQSKYRGPGIIATCFGGAAIMALVCAIFKIDTTLIPPIPFTSSYIVSCILVHVIWALFHRGRK